MNPLFYPFKIYGERFAWPKRRKVIVRALTPFFSGERTVLDVGCGDGKLAQELKKQCHRIIIHGADNHISSGYGHPVPCVRFDGGCLPFPDKSYDTCMLIDVLHHSQYPETLLKETARVARHSVIVKDHDYRSRLDFRLMQAGDYLGNRMFGIDLPYQFKRWEEFENMFRESGLSILQHDHGLKPAGLLELHDHFIVKLVRKSP